MRPPSQQPAALILQLPELLPHFRTAGGGQAGGQQAALPQRRQPGPAVTYHQAGRSRHPDPGCRPQHRAVHGHISMGKDTINTQLRLFFVFSNTKMIF
ncbi:MAG: hypothetical protein WC601_04595 [Desulfotomaculaceae bacterium]